MLTDILVHPDPCRSSAARLAVAVDLARLHRARLTGLLLMRHGHPSEAEALTAQDLFQHQAREAGLEVRWRQVDGSVARHLLRGMAIPVLMSN